MRLALSCPAPLSPSPSGATMAGAEDGTGPQVPLILSPYIQGHHHGRCGEGETSPEQGRYQDLLLMCRATVGTGLSNAVLVHERGEAVSEAGRPANVRSTYNGVVLLKNSKMFMWEWWEAGEVDDPEMWCRPTWPALAFLHILRAKLSYLFQ